MIKDRAKEYRGRFLHNLNEVRKALNEPLLSKSDGLTSLILDVSEKAYSDGAYEQEMIDIDKASNWLFGYIRSTDMKTVSAYDVEREFRNYMNL